MKALLATFAMCFLSGSFALASVCQNAKSNWEISECMRVQYIEIDKVLNSEYQKTRTRISNSNFKPEEKTEALQTLVKAQRSWISYRDNDCALEGIEFIGGNGGGMQIQSCLISKTEERISVLKNVLRTN